MSISSIDLKFTPRSEHEGRALGACIVFDAGTQNVVVNDITCMGAWSGVIVLNPSHYPRINDDPIHDIYIKNIISDSVYNTGIIMQVTELPVYNITWEEVKVLKGVPAAGLPCYYLEGTWSRFWANCSNAISNNWTDVWFKDFMGTVDHPLEGGVPDQSWGRVNPTSVVDSYFLNWAVQGK